jgi:hypothetical protein
MYRAMQLVRSAAREAAVQELPRPGAWFKKKGFRSLPTRVTILHRFEQFQCVQQTLEVEPVPVVVSHALAQTSRQLFPAIPGSIAIETVPSNASQTTPIVAQMIENPRGELRCAGHAKVNGATSTDENS